MPSFPLFRFTTRFRSMSVLIVAALVATGCATHRPAPVEERTLGRGAPRSAPSVRPESPMATSEAPLAATYTVKRGDTLHQIALDNGLDYRELAAWNNIGDVNKIYPGQVLRLNAPGSEPARTAVASPAPVLQQDAANGVVTAPLRSPPSIGESRPPSASSAQPAAPPPLSTASVAASEGALKTSPKAVKLPYSEQAVRELELAASAGPAPRSALPPPATVPETKAEPRDATPPLTPSVTPANPAPATSKPPPSLANASPPGSSSASAAPSAPSAASAPGGNDSLDWVWPAKGKIVSGFSETANLKGIDIAGTAGEPVRASAPGRVVYAGNGLRGYGKLIIIKHNDTYLSAYAHNREILVKEGQQVTRGQKIAEMGNTDADQVKLHFEIRRHGKPMDPTKYLPPT